MYNTQVIQDEFIGLVGLRQTLDPNFEKLAPILTKGASNVLIHHPLLNIENLEMTSRNYAEWVYDEYNALTTYNLHDRVMVGSDIYESLVNGNTGNTPASNPVQWQKVSLLSLYLDDVYRHSIDEVVNQVINLKRLRKETKTLLRELHLYEGVGSMNDLIVNQGDLVGFEIKLLHSRNLVAVIEKIGHQFSGVGEFDMWLYHSSQNESIAQFTVTRTKAYSFEWATIAHQIQHVASSHDAGGTFYLVYDQSQIPGQALNRGHVWGTTPCGGCSPYNLNAYNQYSKYLEIHPVRIKAADRNTVNDEPDLFWNIDSMKRENETNYGLNLSFTVRCDLTDFLVAHKEVFGFAIRDVITVKLLESIANSTRQNAIDEKIKSLAMIALQNGGVGGGGARQQAMKQIEAIDFEFSGFNDFCLPCNNKNGLSWGSVSLNY